MVRTAVAVVDFIYYAQFHVHTSETLAALQAALDTFHANKDIFIELNIREHFNIPKLHQMMHYVAAIKSRGSADGYNTESPERLHIDYAKDAYQASNKREYIKQMTVWLRRQEAIAQFSGYLDWLSQTQWRDDPYDFEPPPSDDSDSDDDLEPQAVLQSDKNKTTHDKQTHLISIKPAFPRATIDTLTSELFASKFLDTLIKHCRRTNPPPQLVTLPNQFDRFDAYKILPIPLPDLHAVGRRNSCNKVRAIPLIPGRSGRKDKPAQFDTVLVRTNDDKINKHTEGTALEGNQP